MQILSISEYSKAVQSEIQEIFENLEEGIVTVYDGSISYSNKVFIDSAKSVHAMEQSAEKISDEIMDKKLFKVHSIVEGEDQANA